MFLCFFVQKNDRISCMSMTYALFLNTFRSQRNTFTITSVRSLKKVIESEKPQRKKKNGRKNKLK